MTNLSTRSAKSDDAGEYRQPSIRVSRFTTGLPKVLILHDHGVVVDALKMVLEDIVEIVAETTSGKSAVALSELLVPDVVVCSELVSDGLSEYFIPALLQTGSRVLYMAERPDAPRILELAELGITGVVDDGQGPQDVATGVLVLAAGGAFLPPDAVATIATEWRRNRRRGSNDVPGVELTSRELEVLGAMTDGLSTKAVAHHLGIAAKTVEHHKSRIFHKLGVKTQAQAVARATGTGVASGSLNQGHAAGSQEKGS
jgi:DNA-binding NarL/FixJ family response regulator